MLEKSILIDANTKNKPYIYFYIKNENLSTNSLVKLLNSTEALIYLGLFNVIYKLKLEILGITKESKLNLAENDFFRYLDFKRNYTTIYVENELNLKYHKLSKVEKNNFDKLEYFELQFKESYYSFLSNKYLHENHEDLIIKDKFLNGPDFDYEIFLEWVRSRFSDNLIIKEINTNHSYEILLDFVAISTILGFPDNQVTSNLILFIVERLRTSLKQKFRNLKNPEVELIKVLSDGEEIIIREPQDKNCEYDIKVVLGDERYIHMKKTNKK